jgi:hypothetical protein
VAVGDGVYFDNERGKEDVHAKAVHPDKTTTMLTLMGTEAVECIRNPKLVTRNHLLLTIMVTECYATQ